MLKINWINVIKSKKEPLIFPNGSEALADIYMGNWAFSSKAKGIGGKPSIGYLSRVCYEFSISDTEFIIRSCLILIINRTINDVKNMF